MTDIYTNTPMTQRMEQARSVFGDNPSDVARGVATNMTNSPTFQQPLQDQKNALGAMDQIAAYDKELAGKYQTGNQQATAQNQQQNAMLTSFAGAGATPQDTIAKGASAIPTTNYQSFNGILSPFVASGLASGQQQAATDTFDMASQTRSSLEKTVGTEAQAYAEALKYALAEEQYKVEQEQAKQKLIDDKEKEKWNREYELLKLTGGTIYNPWDEKTYTVPAPETSQNGTFDVQSALQLMRGSNPQIQGSGTTNEWAINPSNPRPPLESFEIQDKPVSAVGEADSYDVNSSPTLNMFGNYWDKNWVKPYLKK